MQTRKTSRMNIPDIVNHHRTADKGTSRENQTALGSGRHFPLQFLFAILQGLLCLTLRAKWKCHFVSQLCSQPSEIMKMWRLRHIHFTQTHHPWWIFMDSSSLRCFMAKSLGNWPSRPNWKCIPASKWFSTTRMGTFIYISEDNVVIPIYLKIACVFIYISKDLTFLYLSIFNNSI